MDVIFETNKTSTTVKLSFFHMKLWLGLVECKWWLFLNMKVNQKFIYYEITNKKNHWHISDSSFLASNFCSFSTIHTSKHSANSEHSLLQLFAFVQLLLFEIFRFFSYFFLNENEVPSKPFKPFVLFTFYCSFHLLFLLVFFFC